MVHSHRFIPRENCIKLMSAAAQNVLKAAHITGKHKSP
jgi:hypothetical protein